MTSEQAAKRATEIAQKLADLFYKEIPGDEKDDRALRNMTHGVFIALTTKNADADYFDLLQRVAIHFTERFAALEEHEAECPGKVKH